MNHYLPAWGFDEQVIVGVSVIWLFVSRPRPDGSGDRRRVRKMIEEILKDFFFIERGYLNGNHFLLRGAQPVLVDTGYIGDFTRTQELLEGLGTDLSSVRLVVNTHTHCDHIGGNAIIQEMSGCEVALHPVGAHA